MLTKQQKREQVEEGVQRIQKSQSVILVDFGGLPTTELKKFRALLKEVGASMRVIKKRLLRLIFQQTSIATDPTQFEAQVGTIFSTTDLYSIAGKVHKFIKDLARAKMTMKLLSVFDVANKRIVSVEEFTAIAKLPNREVLLAQVAMMFTVPIKKIMLALNARKEQLSTK